ncbi:putative nuclease HARBI1 [Montipora foliosa]|uniref:putative nuclease HARBI1 n=1 Tax=Montipora foliosa TaxID=591990 RepID=UPI0035F166F3
MAAERGGVDVMLVLSLIEADDGVVENEMLLEDDDSTLLFTAVIPFMRRSLNRVEGFYTDTLPTYSMDEFKGHFRMTRATCEALVREIVATGNIPIGNRFGRESIDPTKQVMIYLWCMANQEVTRLVADRFNVTFSSVTRILERVTKALLRLRRQFIKWPGNAQLQETADSFEASGGIPGIVGAIDGTLIQIRAPLHDSESYVCRKKFYALQLQVVCDDNLMFLDAMTGWPGSVHDSRVLRNSNLFATAGQKFDSDKHLLGDGGYPLLPWLIVPFRDNGRLTANQRKFNKAQSSLRQAVERAIGLLKGRWRKLLYLDHLDVKLMAKLIMAACVLHNFCLMLDDYDNGYFLPGDGNHDDEDDGGDGGLSAIQQQRIAERKRNHLMDVLCM